MTKCKITVLKTPMFEDLAKEYVTDPNYGPCSVHQVGQTFVTGGIFGNEMPEGFCAQAWQSLVMFDEKHIACCADGLRPVVFLLERVEE